MNITMPVVDENGYIKVKNGSLTPDESNNPVYKARNDVALPKGVWLYGGDDGHNLNRFKNVKQTDSAAQEFEKEALLYLNRYGATVAGSFIARGQASFSLNIVKDPNDNG